MAVFEHCFVLLELKNLPFKEKKKLKSAVTENGGKVSYVVNKQCSLIVTGDVSDLSSNRLRGIQKHRTPVVGLDYVYSCVERGLLLPVDDYRLDAASASSPPLPPLPPSSATQVPLARQEFKEAAAEPPRDPVKPVDAVGLKAKGGEVVGGFRIYTESDSDLPTYPQNFQVAKYSIFEKANSATWCVLELQSCRGETGRRYRVAQYWRDDASTKRAAAAARDTLVFLSTSEEAVQVYGAQRETLLASGLQLTNTPQQAPPHLGSAPLQQLLLEEKLNTASLSREVGVFVELLWTEALGRLGNVLRVPIHKLSLSDVSRVEGLLLQAQRKLREADPSEVPCIPDEVYILLPHTTPLQNPSTAQLISQKLDLCQLIRDVLNVSESTLRSAAPSSLGKYRALRCGIETVPPDAPEFQAVTALLQDRRVQVRQVLRVSRGAELQTFRSEVGNVKPLLHSSSPSNFVGVLSRGLLLPRVGVEHYGIERTDVGHLGSGIYFSDAVSTSLKYSTPSKTDGSRLLLVCDVALGRCRDVRKRDAALTQAPEGHHSVHGVRRTPSARSEFEDDEYVVYSTDQVRLKYVVQFSIRGEQLKEFRPAIDTSAEAPPPSDQGESTQEEDEVESIKNPLADVKAGLMDSSGQQLPLQAVHVKCKLLDLLSQVIVFQTYTNRSPEPIEAKYVFPLDDSAAVCGFEAFIDGKHVVGQVKEKEAARKEYKQAVEKGHGAYLLDQDAPDVFTISVGNLPPGATVLIKVSFVSELIVKDGSVVFSLPGSVAPWQQSAAINQTTQVSVQKVCVTDGPREFSLDVSVEMPNKITGLQCVTHKVKIKRTDCKAVVSVLPGEVMGQDGFELSITLAEVHLPRMWVEEHPDKDSQASMLVFYPDFEVDSGPASDEVVLLVDSSESMRGEPLRAARRIARRVLGTLDQHLRLNVVFFGTNHTEAFLAARPLAEARPAAESFIKLSSPVGGSTELWRPLRALSLLPPSRGVRNLLLLSDGHLQNAELALRLLRDDAGHSRLFTCGLSPTANRHMLRALAQAGGGAFEYFDTKTKHNWADKVARQLKRMASPGCSSVSVKWQQFNPAAPPPVQAPKLLHALFNDCHTLVYGFVPHCTQATLLGNLSGQEIKTMVSTSELQKTKGTFLHKLTARALIRDYEDGSLDSDEAEHEGKKAELKRFIVQLSTEFSILSQFTSFVAIEERDSGRVEVGFTDIPELISQEDVDFLPYIGWSSPRDAEGVEEPMDMDVDLDYWMGDEEEECGAAMSHEFDEVDDDDDNEDEERAEGDEDEECEFDAVDDDDDDEWAEVRSGEDDEDEERAEGDEDEEDEECAVVRSHEVDEEDEDDEDEECAVVRSHKVDEEDEDEECAVDDDDDDDDDDEWAEVTSQDESEGCAEEDKQPVFPHYEHMSCFLEMDTLPHVVAPPPPPPPPPFPVLPGQPQPSGLSFHPPSPPFLPLKQNLLSISGQTPVNQRGPAGAAALHDFMGGVGEPKGSPFGSQQQQQQQQQQHQLKQQPQQRAFPLRAGGSGVSREGSLLRRSRGASRRSGRPAEGPSARFTMEEPLSLRRPPVHVEAEPPVHVEAEPSTKNQTKPMMLEDTFCFRSSNLHQASRGSPASPAGAAALHDFIGGVGEPVLKEKYKKKRGVAFMSLLGAPAECETLSSAEPPSGIWPPGPKGSPFGSQQQQQQIKQQQLKQQPQQLSGYYSGAAYKPAFPLRAGGSGVSGMELAPQEPQQQQQLKLQPQQPQQQSGYYSGMDPMPVGRGEASKPALQIQSGLSSGFGFSFGGSGMELAQQEPQQLKLQPQQPQQQSGYYSGAAYKRSFPLRAGGSGVSGMEDCSLPRMSRNASVHVEAEPPVHVEAEPSTKNQTKPMMLEDTFCFRPSNAHQISRVRKAAPEALQVRWTNIFQMQHSEGYWELTTELGELVDFNVDLFANDFLKNKGIRSLGVRAHTDILRLVATLLVLQLMRVQSLKEGKLLRTLFSLEDSSLPRPAQWEEVKRAVDWVCWADRQYPCVYSRLEFGLSWETSTRQLLGFQGFQGLPPSSALTSLKLQRADRRVLGF